ncbi:hypothetical protein ACFYVL_31690 [Streptomyces sp. NPDC004111]|uniref:hypothetical protein n=1 Tax=Streptomyces sp. NPDC004111 TaxID=3364690 RepID=UPI0036BC1F4C
MILTPYRRRLCPPVPLPPVGRLTILVVVYAVVITLVLAGYSAATVLAVVSGGVLAATHVAGYLFTAPLTSAGLR